MVKIYDVGILNSVGLIWNKIYQKKYVIHVVQNGI